MIARLILHPRLMRRGYRYDVEHEGLLIVVGSGDPEHDGARALVHRGIGGLAETIDANTGKARLRFDIKSFAATRTVERTAGGLTVEPWRPRPSEISHRGAQTSVSHARDRKVADTSEQASVTGGGTE